ncbi:hypothetical protein MAR_014260 [Mya arenaria]|uniref:Uncharacterized protein n=1 Tax=Mya arenaria TaxID=6604 RepID=A0ABY7GBH5_MYAAR|nr:hypothetical protein MAR_014260 [Mya arenaria]
MQFGMNASSVSLRGTEHEKTTTATEELHIQRGIKLTTKTAKEDLHIQRGSQINSKMHLRDVLSLLFTAGEQDFDPECVPYGGQGIVSTER